MSFTVISPKDKKKIRELLGEESTCVFQPTEYQKSLIRSKAFSLRDETQVQADPVSIDERSVQRMMADASESLTSVVDEHEPTPSTWVITNLIPEIPKSK